MDHKALRHIKNMMAHQGSCLSPSSTTATPPGGTVTLTPPSTTGSCRRAASVASVADTSPASATAAEGGGAGAGAVSRGRERGDARAAQGEGTGMQRAGQPVARLKLHLVKMCVRRPLHGSNSA